MRKIQINLNEEAWALLEGTTKEANENFELGSITYSDVATEAILQSRIDVRALQAKHVNLRKSLRLLSTKKDIDFDTVIRQMTEFKQRCGKRSAKSAAMAEGSEA